MEKLNFSITIDAEPQTVYRIMLDQKTYREWTAVFNPSSYFEGSWEKGSQIRFIGTDQNGKKGGIVSRIRENEPARFVSIEHLGLIEGDQEITSGTKVEGWAGALENYSFKRLNGGTMLSVEVDLNQEFKAYFSETWPKALHKLKTLCEGETKDPFSGSGI